MSAPLNSLSWRCLQVLIRIKCKSGNFTNQVSLSIKQQSSLIKSDGGVQIWMKKQIVLCCCCTATLLYTPTLKYLFTSVLRALIFPERCQHFGELFTVKCVRACVCVCGETEIHHVALLLQIVCIYLHYSLQFIPICRHSTALNEQQQLDHTHHMHTTHTPHTPQSQCTVNIYRVLYISCVHICESM